MKKIILIPALLVGSLTFASDYSYELTPVVGYGIAEGNLHLDNQTLVGLEAQHNSLDSAISPELSVLYTNADYDSPSNSSANIYRMALNGVYEFNKLGSVIPLVKAGAGYETMSRRFFDNRDSAFVDAGVGAKVPFTKQIALKLEAVYMLKNNHNRWDNNLALLAGLNYAFGPKIVAVDDTDMDSDNDGVADSMDKCPSTPAGVQVDANGCKVDGDDDNDGVKNSMDKCPSTPAGVQVDANGCKVDGDDDNDGVKNSMDKCPSTPAGAKVNSDGCPAIVNLHINFNNNSYSVDNASDANIQQFADFLNMYSNYSAKIVGYTDNKGSASYNQKLSLKRANALKAMLVNRGVKEDRITTSGMGKKNPIADNNTAEGCAKNRRIEAELHKN